MSVISSVKPCEFEQYHRNCFFCKNKQLTKSWIKRFDDTDRLLNHLKQCVFRNEWSKEIRSEVYQLVKKSIKNGFDQATIQRISELERFSRK